MDNRKNTGTATSRRHLPDRRLNETFAFDWLGMNFVATISRFDDNTIGEIFLSNGRVIPRSCRWDSGGRTAST